MGYRLISCLAFSMLGVAAFAQWAPADVTRPGTTLDFPTGSAANQWCGYTGSTALPAYITDGTTTTTLSYPGGTAQPHAMSATLVVGSELPTGTFFSLPFSYNRATSTYTNLLPTGFRSGSATSTWGPYSAGEVQDSSGTFHAWVWFGSAHSSRDLSPSGTSGSQVNGISGGNLVGQANNGIPYPVLWTGFNNTPINLDPVNGGSATCIDGGTQGGYFSIAGNAHPAIWNGTAGSEVDLLPTGYVNGTVNAIYGNTQVGFVTDASGNRFAALWTGSVTSFVNLGAGLPTGYSASAAATVTSDGTAIYVTGSATPPSGVGVSAIRWVHKIWTCYPLTTGTYPFGGTANCVHGQYVGGTIDATSAIWELNFFTLAQGRYNGISSILSNTVYTDGQTLAYGASNFSHPGLSISRVGTDASGHAMEVGIDSNLGGPTQYLVALSGPLGGETQLPFPFTNVSFAFLHDFHGGAPGGAYVDGSDHAHAIYWPTISSQPVALEPPGVYGSSVAESGPTSQVGSIITLVGQNDRACIWYGTAASYTDLHPAGAIYSYGIGQVGSIQVGEIITPSDATHPYIWYGSAASGVDLMPTCPSGLVGASVTGASSYNGHVVISGNGMLPNGTTMPMVWIRN